MATLPARPDLGHLRRQARDLLRAARSRDSAAAARIASVSTTLATAQLAVAREYGFASWARLKTAVDARTRELAELADAFCEASIRSGTSQAARMLASTGNVSLSADDAKPPSLAVAEYLRRLGIGHGSP